MKEIVEDKNVIRRDGEGRVKEQSRKQEVDRKRRQEEQRCISKGEQRARREGALRQKIRE